MVAPSSQKFEPKVKLRVLTEDYCEFVLSNVDSSIANALRRIILVEVLVEDDMMLITAHSV